MSRYPLPDTPYSWDGTSNQRSRLSMDLPPCSLVPSSSCTEGFSFLELSLTPDEVEEKIPPERRVSLRIGNKILCFDVVELADWFRSTYHPVIEGPFGTCRVSEHQIKEIEDRARLFRRDVPRQPPGRLPLFRQESPLPPLRRPISRITPSFPTVPPLTYQQLQQLSTDQLLQYQDMISQILRQRLS